MSGIGVGHIEASETDPLKAGDDTDPGRAEARQAAHPWQRQPGESSKAFGKFCEYRDLGPDRSLEKLRRLHEGEDGWSRPALHELSERWRWSARAAAWDEEQDRARRQAQSEAIREMAERQARDGADMQRLARGAMAKWVKPDPHTRQLVLAENLSPSEVARLYRLGFEVERLARGEPTQVTERRDSGEEEFDEGIITAGVAYALAQAGSDEQGMDAGGEAAGDPASPQIAAHPVDGSAALGPGQAEPPGAPEAQPDSEET